MSSDYVEKRLVESAQYALLMRIAPSLSHHMVGALQPIGMMSAILERRLQSPLSDYAELVSKSSELKITVRKASNVCISLMTWLAPTNDDLITLTEGIEEITGLVMTELAFRGFTIVNKIDHTHISLSRSLTRNVFLAAVLALTDTATGPADVILEAQLVGNELLLTILMQFDQSKLRPSDHLASYRNLEWEDVQALAAYQSVRLTRAIDSVKMYWPLNEAEILFGVS